MTKKQFAEIMFWMASAFPRFELTEPTVEIYWQMLSDIDRSVFKASAIKCISTNRYFPTVEEIRRASFNLLSGDLLDKYSAWIQVGKITNFGDWRIRPELHPVIERAVEAVGGWRSLAFSEHHMSDRARFLEAYDIFLTQYREHKSEPPMLQDMRKAMRLPSPEESE